MALHGDEPEFMNLREWDRRARLSHKKQTSRRFSTSYIGSFREDHHNSSSSRTNFNYISSTASSPGYYLKEEIDPSKYSFTNAIKALQAKTMHNNKEWLAQEKFALNSKWNEAEKYISNPLSGEVPRECLSSKTLSSRSFRNSTTMSRPLHYSKSNPLMMNSVDVQNQKLINHPDVIIRVLHEDLYPPPPALVPDKKVMGLKRNVSVQRASVDLSSALSPAKTPPIKERSLKRHVEANDLLVGYNLKLEGQREALKLVEKVDEEDKQQTGKEEVEKHHRSQEEEQNIKKHTSEEEEEVKQNISEEEEEEKEHTSEDTKKKRGSGCFSWVRSRQRQRQEARVHLPSLCSSSC